MNLIKREKVLLLIIIVFAVYMGIYIYQTSFIVEGTRYFVLFDDAMISMRYAKNFAEGHGLLWNPGEKPVEGYTNPLWVLYMAFFHLLPISEAKMSLPIQISGAVFLLVNLVFVKKITQEVTDNVISPYLAVLVTGLYIPLNNWGLQGMEVSLLVLLVSMTSYHSIKSIKKKEFTPWIYIFLGVSILIRVDMVVPFFVFWCFLLIYFPQQRRKNFIWGTATLFVSLGSQTVFRYIYYGDLLPNTYYLKMTGMPLFLRVKRGLYVLYKFIREMNWVLFILPFLVLLFRYNPGTLLISIVFLGQIAYSVYVGGDAWEHRGGANRYISVAIQLFFVMFIYGWEKIIYSLKGNLEKYSLLFDKIRNFSLIFIVTLSMVNFNFLLRNSNNIKRIFLLYRPHFIQGNKEYVRVAHVVEKITDPEASIAVVTAGSIPYYSERPAIDLLGKNDPYIAKTENHVPDKLSEIRPGHMKWDYEYSIGELKPDLVLGVWGDSQSAERLLNRYYTVVVIDGLEIAARKGSNNILWEKIDKNK